MPQEALLVRDPSVPTILRSVIEGTDQVLLSEIEGTLAARTLWGDAAATTVDLGTGAAITQVNVGTAASVTGMQIGGVNTAVTIPGGLDVQGTTTTINTTNVTISDQVLLIAAQAVPAAEVRSAYVIERGTTGDDLLFAWQIAPQTRVEIGFFDTVGGTTAPAGALANLADVRLNDLSLAGTQITADAGLTVGSTGATDLQLTAQGTTYNFSATGAALITVATDIVGAINEVAGAGAESLAATLAVGNTTGGTNIVVSSGDRITAPDAAGGSGLPGTSITISSGSGDGVGAGGTTTISGGTSPLGIGGPLNLYAGVGPTGGRVVIGPSPPSTAQWQIDNAGNFFPNAVPNVQDIGAGGLNPRTIYADTSFIGPLFHAADTIGAVGTLTTVRGGNSSGSSGGNLALSGGTGGLGNGGDVVVSGGTGTGVAGDVRVETGGTPRWRVDENGHTIWDTDNSIDVGSPDAGTTDNRPRTIYVGTRVDIASGITLSDNALLVADLPVPFMLSRTIGIDAKAVGTTTLYTVPAGKRCVVTGAIITCTAAVAITIPAAGGIGVAAGEDDIFASVTFTNVLAAEDVWQFTPGGKKIRAQATNAIKLGIDTGATGTSQTFTVELFGYLI